MINVNSNENTVREEGPWSNIEIFKHGFEQGQLHADPSPRTNQWIDKFSTMMYAIIILFSTYLVIVSIQIYQTNRILGALELMEQATK